MTDILRNCGPCETHKTAEFCEMMNNFFDEFNVRNSVEGIKTKNFYKTIYYWTDKRFEWLHYTFLPYFPNWKLWIENPEDFSQSEKEKNFILWQTFEGIKIFIYSLFEKVKFLLENGASFVLTEKLSQDRLEEYFGKHHSVGRRNDNPDV